LDKIVRKHWKLSSEGKREYFEKEYFVYTQEEADRQKLAYKPWYEAVPGEYGISDDKYVALCLKKDAYADRKHKTVMFSYSYGRMFATFKKGRDRPHQRLLFEPHRESENFSMVSSKPWYEKEKGRTRNKEFAKAYVIQRTSTGKIDYEQLGKIIDPWNPLPTVAAKKKLKKKWVREMISKEMREVLTEKGVSEGHVIDMILIAAQLATKKSDVTNLLRAAENLAKILHMADKEKTEETWEGESTSVEGVEDALQIEDEMQEKKKLLEEINEEEVSG